MEEGVKKVALSQTITHIRLVLKNMKNVQFYHVLGDNNHRVDKLANNDCTNLQGEAKISELIQTIPIP